MAVFAAVNGEWLNGVVLTKEQIEDYNDGYATAEQLAALLLSPRILKKVDEIQTAKTKQEIDSLQEKKLKLETEIAELKKRRTRQTLWSAVQMLTQKLCCQTIHDCPKVVPLHYESE